MYGLCPRSQAVLSWLLATLSMLSLVPVVRSSSTPEHQRRQTNYGYYIPMDGGGSMLTQVQDTYPPGLGEPINVIISAYSDARVLQSSVDNGGLINYYQSFGFSTECLGQHSGDNQGANLGDGNGYLNQTAVIRWDYGNVQLGTCQETIEGGNHIRYWIQNGPNADSGAIFMALSYEMPIAIQHNIIENGYDLGRDWLVGNATSQSTLIPTSKLTNTSTFSGSTSYNGYTYSTSVRYVSGLLQNSSVGINHYQSVATSGGNAIDGLVAVMTIKITNQPSQASRSVSDQHPELFDQPCHVEQCGNLTPASVVAGRDVVRAGVLGERVITIAPSVAHGTATRGVLFLNTDPDSVDVIGLRLPSYERLLTIDIHS